LSSNEDAPVDAEADAALGERGTEEVATELFEAGLIVWGDRDAGAARTVVSAETSGYPLDPLVYKRAHAAARKGRPHGVRLQARRGVAEAPGVRADNRRRSARRALGPQGTSDVLARDQGGIEMTTGSGDEVGDLADRIARAIAGRKSGFSK
jgi:hypothetical protein